MGSIRRHKNAMSALLAEFYDKPNNNLEFGDEFDDYVTNKKRREDEGSAGGMCQSVVRYARPQKAKAASGEWKFIVNTGQHTQTLRLEKCSNPGDSCSYLAQTYRSHCSQVYNYHRLLSWDKVRGLHVDIFKVPTCCSCQVDGYRQQFPPLSTIQAKDYTPINNYKLDNGYSTINEEDLDYNDESDEDDLGLSYSPYNHHRDTNELSYLASKKVRSKLPLPSSVGPYLSPPDDDNHFGSYKPAHKSSSSSSSISSSSSPSSSSSKNYYQHLSRRRPQQHNEPRVDVDLSLDLAGSETQSEQEVNVFGQQLLAGEQPQQRVPIKRKRIYSSTPTHTATTTTGGTARLPIQHVSHKPQTTAAAAVPSSGSLPARTGAAAAAASGGATYAHEAAGSVASGATAPSDAAFHPGQRISHYANGEKPRPRFYAPLPTTPAAPVTIPAGAATPLLSPSSSSSTTTVQQKQSTPQFSQPASHLNSIYSNSNHHNNGSRRINYSYHPIIDFFEQRANSRVDQHQQEFVVGATQRVEQRYPSTTASKGNFQQTFPTANERRMGFGAGGGGGVASGAVRYGYVNDNAWQPLVVDH
ncbi:GH15803 [Drosophila grimshawi]|uniref:GH15803 n=1 Tax=Drosophila grimshawi TaxID=7222 RepID=B4IZ86_DROGR|nr:GH15803 [Drosophila grimshawi]